MRILSRLCFASPTEVNLPLSKSEGIRALISLYLLRRGRGQIAMPPRDELIPDDAPEDLQVLYVGLQILLAGSGTDIRLSASASVARFLVALAAAEGRRVSFRLTDNQLLRRPMRPLEDYLHGLGVSVERNDKQWVVDSSCLSVPRETIVDARAWESSQFVSAIIYFSVAGNYPLAIHRQYSTPSSRYIALTIEYLRQIGVDLTWQADWIRFKPREQSDLTRLKTYVFHLPADYTSASYWLELQTLHPEIHKLVLRGIDPDSLHPDTRLLSYYNPFLDFITADDALTSSRRPVSGGVRPLFFDLSQNPDLFPTLFATVIGLGMETTFTGLSSLAYKESDRLGASLSIAQDLGWPSDAFINVTPNGFTYTGVPRETEPEHVTLNHRGDHRLAMAFGVLATTLEKTHVEIPDDKAVTSRSYPHFFTDLCRQAR